ncbi:MAG: S-adenosylmethionine synthase [Methylotenera sp. RIFCSPLOWO2_02_FULL_45_14]|nr:MAG: S-adenosylmethionine synthase [Methylotenera sp. RIFCSPLOWO2_02_FULL_45_14]
MHLEISLLEFPAVDALPLEIVERKGIGHPDTICDALAEELSRTLSRYYLDQFGLILHHNVDKALLCGGQSRACFSGGEVLKPIEIYLAGRATEIVGGVRVPLQELAIESSRRWLRENLRFIDIDRHVRLHCHIRPGSAELTELFLRQQEVKMTLANDTSCGVGYAPLNALENLVLQVERHLNSPAVKAVCPAIGEDIKVMGVRRGSDINLTVACAMVGQFITDMPGYIFAKAQVAELTRAAARMAGVESIEVAVNAADGVTAGSIYLTVTGTSAESGDDGEVGRGNRVNGLITFYRPMSIEAAAGKNPVSHVGKLYNLLAHRIAQDIVSNVAGIDEVYCYLLGQIGRPINEPAVIDLKLRLAPEVGLGEVQMHVNEIVRHHLETLGNLWRELIMGSILLF